MSFRKIEAALRRKGIKAETLECDWQATPHGMARGWHIVLVEEHSEALVAMGHDDSPDAETAEEVLEWIEGLPDVTAQVAAMAIMSDLRGRSGVLDGIDEDIVEEIEEAVRGHVEAAYEGRMA